MTDADRWADRWQLVIATAISLYAGLVPIAIADYALYDGSNGYNIPSPINGMEYVANTILIGAGMAMILCPFLLAAALVVLSLYRLAFRVFSGDAYADGRVYAAIGGAIILYVGIAPVWSKAEEFNLAVFLALLAGVIGSLIFLVLFPRIYELDYVG